MKFPAAVAAVPILLVLLTWFLLRGMTPDMQVPVHALKALDDFTIAESALHRDILTARAGMLRNYDPLVREVAALNESIARLREFGTLDPDKMAAVNRVAGAVHRQEELVERFKSDNALLQNSLVYFGLYSARLGASNHNGPLVPAVSNLAAAILHLTLDTSPATAGEVANHLDALAAQTPPLADAAAVQALLAHGRLLHTLLPATDDVLKSLFAVPSHREIEDVRAMVLRHQTCAETAARRFAILLYAMSLVLLASLVHLGLQLRMRAVALQRHAAFEHLIADISTRFISSSPHEVEHQLDQALIQLARWIGADRAYFTCACMGGRVHAWCRDQTELPVGWPRQALALARRLGPTSDGLIHVPLVDQLPSGPERDELASAGLSGWACAVRFGEGTETILGFDVMEGGIMVRSAELSLLRMALDALSNAVDRDCLERERTRLETNLNQARRMETVGALASGIAHNFNNIVGAILGYTEMVEAQVPAESRPARHIQEIRRAGERARYLVDQILAFGRRRDTSRRKPLCVKGMLAEARSLLQASLPSQVEVLVRDVPGMAMVAGELGQLQQVVLNLCNNAAQAMDEGGSIEIETLVLRITRPRMLSHGQLAPGLYVCIAVCDTGRGMDEATLERIFEPFFTTRLAGYGLGLATVREIVREHGGAINVRSAPGCGSRFEAWLPSAAEVETWLSEEEAELPLGHGQTVLVVNDEREGLLRDEELLAALGYEPVGFLRPADAIQACQVLPERFDALVISHLLPVGAVIELATALHDFVPELPIVLATATMTEINAETLAAARIAEIVHRPLASDEIAAALKRSIVGVIHA